LKKAPQKLFKKALRALSAAVADRSVFIRANPWLKLELVHAPRAAILFFFGRII
jgi:hypothetical protein